MEPCAFFLLLLCRENQLKKGRKKKKKDRKKSGKVSNAFLKMELEKNPHQNQKTIKRRKKWLPSPLLTEPK